MQIQPRKYLLEIWRAAVASSLSPEGEWIWGGRDGSDSISDAEQLLCLMLPATEVYRFRLNVPDKTDAEVLATLEWLGDAVEIPRRLARICLDYLKRYTLDDGNDTPSFAGGRLTAVDPSVSGEPTTEQLQLDVVESYALSVTLTLSILGFGRILRHSVTRADLRAELDELEARAAQRLTAAMIGLLRSFCVNVFPLKSSWGEQALRAVNQSGAERRRLVDDLHAALRDTAAGLRDLTIGIEAIGNLNDPTTLFECGWSWGLVLNAPEVEFVSERVVQRKGYAQAVPYLYFTAVALDGIGDLFSDRTRLLGLLDDEQQRLAAALRLRWDLIQMYWATLATFGARRWPLEDIPWRTVDGQESDYMSLLVTSIAVRDLAYRRDTDPDLTRVGHLLRELGNRGRVTRRLMWHDPAAGMHHPGFALELEGATAFGPRLSWFAADYAPLLLKRTLQVAGLVNGIEPRDGLLEFADEIWQHLLARRIGTGPSRDLWDQPGQWSSSLPTFDQPSWHHTFRVVESLVMMANLVDTTPLHSEPLTAYARHLLAQAEHLYAQELLAGSASVPGLAERMKPLGQRLERARGLMGEVPARATAVLIGVLQELDALAAARSGG
jgi:hypothetical protein